jgi:putative membrane protein
MGLIQRFIVQWAFNVGALWVAAKLLDGIHYGDFWTLVIAALVFTIVNIFVKPILTVLAIPFIIVTLGLALFFINLLMIYLTSWIVSDFDIDGFWWAVAATIIVWAVNAVFAAIFRDVTRPTRPAEV